MRVVVETTHWQSGRSMANSANVNRAASRLMAYTNTLGQIIVQGGGAYGANTDNLCTIGYYDLRGKDS